MGCSLCGEEIKHRNKNPKYCSLSCMWQAKRLKSKKNWTGQCVHCGASCKRGNKYCVACARDRVYNACQSTESVSKRETVRRFLIKKRGARCEGCHLDEWRGKPIPLELHHEDGNGDNNEEHNLKLLCPNCHALTPTYRSRNPVASESRRRKRKTREFASVAQVAEPLICNQQVEFSSNSGCSIFNGD